MPRAESKGPVVSRLGGDARLSTGQAFIDAADETSENKASGKVGAGRGECRDRRCGLYALDCGGASYSREWERHQNGFWTESAAGTDKNRVADHATRGAGGAERGNASPDQAVARTGERPSPRDFFAPERMGAHGTGASSTALLHAGLCRAHFYRLERDSRGSRLPRRSGDCLRDGSLSRRGSHRGGPAESARRETARVSKLWHAAPGRISESAAGDEDCGEIQTAHFNVGEYHTALTRTASGRAWPRRSHRPQLAGDGAAADANRRYRDWRRRKRRGAGDCRGRSRVDDGKLGLLGDFAGGLRVDHVARSQQEGSGGGGHEDHGERFKRTWMH